MSTVTNATGFARYARITEKEPREIVMLRGSGCQWKRCRFCDYHLDGSPDEEADYQLNQRVLSYVDGRYHDLEVINSGSFCDLDEKTLSLILRLCRKRAITTIHFETHWIHRFFVPAFKARFEVQGVECRIKMGVETFDTKLRRSLDKGMDSRLYSPSPEEIARYADEINLLEGLPGQSVEGMESDIETGLGYFKRICVNVMTKNSAPVQPDERVVELCKTRVLPEWMDDPRVDILLDNEGWGLGAPLAEGRVAPSPCVSYTDLP